MTIQSQTVMRNFVVVDLSPEGTVVIETEGRRSDTGLTAEDFAAPDQIEDGGTFDYLTERERRVLRRGYRLPKRARKSRMTWEPGDVTPVQPQAPEVAPSGPLTCRMCKTTKPAEEFSLMRSSKTGRRSYCRSCAKAYADARKDVLS